MSDHSSARPSAWSQQWRRMMALRSGRWSWRLLLFLGFTALFGDFLANDKPLYCKMENGDTYFPVVASLAYELALSEWPDGMPRTGWKGMTYQNVTWAPIPWSAQTVDPDNMSAKSPLGSQRVSSWRWRHWLGTDRIGRDVLAGLISGTRTALLVGFIAMSLACLIGLPLGLLAGYYGNSRLQVSLMRLILVGLGLLAGLFLASAPRALAFQEGNPIIELGKSLGIWAGVAVLAWWIGKGLERTALGRWRVRLPVDNLVMRLVEIVQSIPALLLLLSLIALLSRPNTYFTMCVIGLLAWPLLTRFIRAEVFKLRDQAFVDNARVLGFGTTRILWRHILPNAIGPLLVALAFGFAEAVLLESSLSFLGLGVSAETVTWGSLLAAARNDTGAWWLAVFPGLAIFITVLTFNYLGDALSESQEPGR